MTRLAAAAVLLAAAPASAALFADFDPTLNDRFLVRSGAAGNVENPDSLLGSFDLTGLGVQSRGGVLISDRHLLAAGHFSGNTTSYTFVNALGNEVTRGTSVRRLAQQLVTNDDGTTTMADSDLAIITLSAPLAAADLVTPLPVAIPATAPDAFNDFDGILAYAYDQNDRIGSNLVDGGFLPGTTTTLDPVTIAAFDGGVFPTVTTVTDFDTPQNSGTNGVGGSEFGLVGGDSGHASLAVINGELAALGTHYGIAFAGDGPALNDNYLSLSSLAGAYADQIQAAVDADGGVGLRFVAVPEPTLGALALLPLALLARRR